MKAAAVICFLVALILFGTAIAGFHNDIAGAPDRSHQEFADTHDDTAFYRDIHEHHDAQQATMFEALGGVVFLIGGLVLWNSGKKKVERD